MTAASDVQMELLFHTVRRLAKAPVSALLVHKVSMFYSQTQSNIDHADYIDSGRGIKFKSVCLHAQWAVNFALQILSILSDQRDFPVMTSLSVNKLYMNSSLESMVVRLTWFDCN